MTVTDAFHSLVSVQPLPSAHDGRLQAAADHLRPDVRRGQRGQGKGSSKWWSRRGGEEEGRPPSVRTAVLSYKTLTQADDAGMAQAPMLNCQYKYSHHLQQLVPKLLARGMSTEGMLARGGVPGGAKLRLQAFTVQPLPTFHRWERGGGYDFGELRDGLPYAAVYQRGEMIWDGESKSTLAPFQFEPRVRANDPDPLEVVGDVTLAVWRSREHFEYTEPPAMAMAFHTGCDVFVREAGGDSTLSDDIANSVFLGKCPRGPNGLVDFPELFSLRRSGRSRDPKARLEPL